MQCTELLLTELTFPGPEPRSAEGVECKKCGESMKYCQLIDECTLIEILAGYFARDCPTGGGENGCRNCGQEGHRAKECMCISSQLIPKD